MREQTWKIHLLTIITETLKVHHWRIAKRDLNTLHWKTRLSSIPSSENPILQIEQLRPESHQARMKSRSPTTDEQLAARKKETKNCEFREGNASVGQLVTVSTMDGLYIYLCIYISPTLLGNALILMFFFLFLAVIYLSRRHGWKLCVWCCLL